MPNDEFGDFQTPAQLAQLCLRKLHLPSNARVLEPTCGLGSFLYAAAQLAPQSERIGVEIQPQYAKIAQEHGRVVVGDIFHMRLPRDVRWKSDGPLFIIGNPPWVTSAELNRMSSPNLPKKRNLKGARGIDALLGSSNFDVCEYIILKALDEFQHEPFTLGMLCKTQVARNVIEHAASAGYPMIRSAVFRINAIEWFNAAVDACWFVVSSDPGGTRDYTAKVHDSLVTPTRSTTRFGIVDGRMVADVNKYAAVRAADGKSRLEWRSGLKHDAVSVFELTAAPQPTTQRGEELDLEPDYIFPFLKSTDIFRGRHTSLSKWVIVPQRSLGEDTAHLENSAPKLWEYLEAHRGLLDNRKSSIYRNRPSFSVFGLGAYTFAPHKVAVSGLHKKPVFRLVSPIAGKPVVLDDTCYFLPFQDEQEAAAACALLNSQPCHDLIESLVFWDSKRPLTKKLLTRIDLDLLPNGRHQTAREAP